MATAEILNEGDVSISRLDEIFKRAFFKTAIDSDGDLIVQTEGPRVWVTLNPNHRLVKFMAIYGVKEAAPVESKHALANKMNDEIIFVRFSIPQADVLMADYYLPYEEAIPVFQIVAALRLFARVVPAAIRACDEADIVE